MPDAASVRLEYLSVKDAGRPDGAFVVFASPEERCLGSARLFRDYKANVVCTLRITDEENEEREKNLERLREFSRSVGNVVDCPVTHSDPVAGIADLVSIVAKTARDGGAVTVDVSTFPKNALLLTLRALGQEPALHNLRLIYTEPGEYTRNLDVPLSYGLKRIGVVPTFAAPYRANQELVLIMFLGYERDRALGIWQSIEPHRTIAVIPCPAYHPEWEGLTEHLNAALLAALRNEDVYRVDPRTPFGAYNFLKKTVGTAVKAQAQNFYVAPLGTKPQTVGLACFCKQFPSAATVVYAAPLEHNHEYISKGIGPTWWLPCPKEDT